MGHTKPEVIADLKGELDIIRGLPELKEKGFGVFYYKSTPFMHFHHKEDKRWADVKTIDKKWLCVDIRFNCTANERKKFIKKILEVHATFYTGKSNPSTAKKKNSSSSATKKKS